MSVSVMCPNCFSTMKIDRKRCKKCGKNLSKARVYRVRVKVGRVWRTKRVEGLELAKQIEAKYKTEALEYTELGIMKAPTIDEVWKLFDAYCKRNLKNPVYYQTFWNLHIKPEFSGLKLDQIKPNDLDRFLNKLTDSTRKPCHNSNSKVRKSYSLSTITNILKTIKRLYSFAEKREIYTGPNPTRYMTLPKYDNQMTNVLKRDELKRLIEVLDHWPNRLPALGFKMLLLTGKRAGEVFGLTWDRVNFEAETITFFTKSQVKDKKQILPMGKTVKDILTEAIGYRDKGGLVFHTPSGKRIHYGPIWRRIKKEAKLPKEFRAHDLRHTFASYLASSGEVDIYTLQNLLGHESIEMTKRYAHIMDNAMKKGVSVAEKVLG